MRTSSPERPARAAALAALIALLAGCSGGGAGGGSTPTAAQSAQLASGTLTIGIPGGNAAAPSVRFARGNRSPDYVSGDTKHAALFIDGATAAAGSTSSCTPSSCTISWAATLSVPATHTFAVEIDDAGVHPYLAGNTPYVLAEGSGSYAVVAGSNNALTTLSLNGVAASFGTQLPTCTMNTCSRNITIQDVDLYTITYSGASYSTPTEGQIPTSGQVFDNDGGGSSPIQVQSDQVYVGNLIDTTDSPYTSYNPDQSALIIQGVNSTGTYPITVACVPGVTGSFGYRVTGATGPSGDVTTAELSALSPPVSYGHNGANPDGRLANLFMCTNGQISIPYPESGSLPVN